MSNPTDPGTTPDQVERLWASAVAMAPGDPSTKALAFRGNVRVNVLQAFKAAYYSAKLYIEGKVALATGAVTPIELAKLAKGGIDAAIATFRTFYETMSEAEYVTALVLSQVGDGVSEQELQAQVLAFIDSVPVDGVPFYLCLGKSVLANAKAALTGADAMTDVVKSLVKRDLAQRQGDKLQFKAKHLEWGFKLA